MSLLWCFVRRVRLPLFPLTSISVIFSVGTTDETEGARPVDPLVFRPDELVAPLLVNKLFKNPVYDRPVDPAVSSVCRIVKGSSKHSISGLYNLSKREIFTLSTAFNYLALTFFGGDNSLKRLCSAMLAASDCVSPSASYRAPSSFNSISRISSNGRDDPK